MCKINDRRRRDFPLFLSRQAVSHSLRQGLLSAHHVLESDSRHGGLGRAALASSAISQPWLTMGIRLPGERHLDMRGKAASSPSAWEEELKKESLLAAKTQVWVSPVGEGEDGGWDGSDSLMLQHWAKDQDQHPTCLCTRRGSSWGLGVKRTCSGPRS